MSSSSSSALSVQKSRKRKTANAKKRRKSYHRDRCINCGGGGGRDHRREKTQNRVSTSSAPSAAPAAASAATGTGSIDLMSDDDDNDDALTNISTSKSPPSNDDATTNQASTKSIREEHPVDQRAIVHRVKKLLNARQVKNKKDGSDTNGLEDMKNILRSLVDHHREHILQKAVILDQEDKLDKKMFNHIDALLPSTIKRNICRTLSTLLLGYGGCLY